MPEWSPEVVVDERLARRLVDTQFPELAGGSLRLLGEGWDSTVWLVDGRWAFRFPRRAIVVPSIERQAVVLPALAPLLPLLVPVPVFHGRPQEDYPWPFAGAELLPGREACDAALTEDDRARAAAPLARFLRALHGPDPLALPGVAHLPVDQMRRADMSFRVPMAAERFAEAAALGVWRAPASAHGLLEDARQLPPPTRRALVHGDLHLRHVLFDGGAPSGVIDWVDIGLADPAIDLVPYWSLLPPHARAAFLAAYGPVGDDQLLRARVLSLFLCATLAVYARREGLPALEREAVAGLERSVTGQRRSP